MQGLAEEFSMVNPDTYTLQITLPGRFTPDGSDSSVLVTLSDSQVNSLPPYPPGTTLFEGILLNLV